MRDGRRQRLGLQTGTDGTVQDTYLDRILSDVDVAGEPNILSLDPDVNVRTTDQRYLQDAYNYYLGGGYDASQPDFPIQAEDFIGGQTLDTSGDGAQISGAVDTLINVNTPAPISAPGEGMLTQEAIDDLANYPVKNVAEFPTGDAELATQIASEDRAAKALADEQALTNLEQARTGQYDTPTETYIGGEKTLEDAGGIEELGGVMGADYQGEEPLSFDDRYESIEDIEKANFPYGINPTTGEPYKEPRTIADQNAVLGQTFEEQKDPAFWENARDEFIQNGKDIGNFFTNATKEGIDIAKTAGTTIINLVGKALLNVPLLGTAIDLIGGALPSRDPRQTALEELYDVKDGTIQSGLMTGYNPVSGNPLDPTYGLQDAYQKRIETINKALGNMTLEEYQNTDLIQRKKDLEEAMAKEKSRLDLFSGDVDERDQMLEDISLQNKIDAEIKAIDDDAGSEMLNEQPIGNQGSTVDINTGDVTDSEGDYAGNIMDESPAPAALVSVSIPAHISGGEGDYGGTGQSEAQDNWGGGWGGGYWAKGGRVGYGKGGIVDLLK